MSDSRKCGHGRCGVCGDAGAAARARDQIAGEQDLVDGVEAYLLNEPDDRCGPDCQCDLGEGVFDEYDWWQTWLANENVGPLTVTIVERAGTI